MGVRLTELIVGDEPTAWANAGFDVEGDATWLGTVRVRLVGEDAGRGVRSLGLDGADRDDLDGLAVHAADPGHPPATRHPNGVAGFDHLVVASPDLDRTLEAFTAVGLELRRTRDVGTADRPRRQMFFWLGEPILELVGPAEPSGDGPSRTFGVALTVADLDATAAHLGAACGRVKDAVQPGRRIATLRHEACGMSVPVAFMTAHVRADETR
ncbi:VOC family protein [Actinomarinicola tropica]|uniref:Glyoxalase n=1 Tax=Actinomarinicola tropica TaxID=2789776 RepID=A0A5Q2RKQ1_9ACTN|nr:VOC family protein [Actinomarinicola tropica]QGG96064.1 glyoxalase [Actinomarinicola tropica]